MIALIVIGFVACVCAVVGMMQRAPERPDDDHPGFDIVKAGVMLGNWKDEGK
jgi:hypothetical protein